MSLQSLFPERNPLGGEEEEEEEEEEDGTGIHLTL